MDHREHQTGMDTESRVTKATLSYLGHVVRAGGMADAVMLGRMNGARKRGRPRQRWLDTLDGYSSGAIINNMRRDARDRAGWRVAAQGDKVNQSRHAPKDDHDNTVEQSIKTTLSVLNPQQARTNYSDPISAGCNCNM